MTGTELIVSALVAGTGAGITEGTTGIVGDAYRNLWQSLRAWFAARGDDSVALPDPPAATDGPALVEWQTLLTQAIMETGIAGDTEICEKARQLSKTLESAGRGSAVITHSKGVYNGNHGHQQNYF